MPDGANDADYIAAGAAMQEKLLTLRVWFINEATGENVGSYDVSAAYYNERCVLTAAHTVDVGGGFKAVYCEVSAGANYLTNRGIVVPSYRYAVHPGYDRSSTGSGPDVAIIYLAASLPGTNAVIGGASPGEIVSHGGCGNTATPSTASFRDGNTRGWTAPIDNINPDLLGFNSAYYATTDFTINSQHPPLKGKGLSGDSGGPVYNSAGELIGLNKAQGGGTSSTGYTVYLKLAQTDVLSWIVQNTTNLAPNPPTLALNGVGVLDLTGDTNQIYGILSSTNLADWQEIGLVTNIIGSVTFQDINAPNFAARFYRAVAK